MKADATGTPRGTDVYHPRAVPPRRPAVLLGVAIALTVVWARNSLPVRGTPADAVYTVTYLSNQLAARPAPWAGHVLRMRAVIVAIPLWLMPGTIPVRRPVARLVDPGGRGSLPLVLGPEDGLLAALRRLPVVGALAPPPQAPVWGTPVMYRVQVEAVRGSDGVTYEAVLLDASPPNN